MSSLSRLGRARIVVDDDTRRAHLAAIDAAIVESTPQPRRHGRALAVALAVVLLVPVIAVAAERSAPGDFLYPIREFIHQTAEPSEIHQPPSVEDTRRLDLLRQASDLGSRIGEAVEERASSGDQERAPVSTARDRPAEEQPTEAEETGNGGDRPEGRAEPAPRPAREGDDRPDDDSPQPETRPTATTTTLPESDRHDQQP